LDQVVQLEKIKQDPVVMAAADATYQGAMGRVKTLRAMGMSTAPVKVPDGMGGYKMVSRYEYMQAKLAEGGWDHGDYASGYGQLLQLGKGYGKYINPISIVSASGAGMTSLAQSAAVGGMLQGDDAAAKTWWKLIQSTTGRRGLDVTVANKLGAGVTGSLADAGSIGGGNSGQMLLAAVANILGGARDPKTGAFTADVGEQQRRLLAYRSGEAQYNAYFNGTASPLDNVMGHMRSIAATGGYSYASRALERQNPALLQAIANGAEIPSDLMGAFSSPEQARAAISSYVKQTNKSLFHKVSSDMAGGADTRQGYLLRELRKHEETGGDFTSFIRGKTSHLEGADRTIAESELVTQFGGLLANASTKENPLTPAQAQGMLFNALRSGSETGLSGTGAHSAAPKGNEKTALEDKNEMVKLMADQYESIKLVLAKLTPAVAALTQQQDFKSTGFTPNTPVGGAINDVIRALQNLGIKLQEKPQSTQPK
jgi:hypothetical protein